MNLKFWTWKKLKEEKTSEIVIRKYEFPCSSDKCIVRAACTQACDKLEMDDNKVKDLFLEHNACPDCGSEKFNEGPSGGAATNVKCSGCGHWFNLGLPLFIQRIHITPNRVFVR